jgi:hypothetical protein
MEENNQAIVVKIGLYSGMPNPEMKLTGDLASEFAKMVRSTIGKEAIHPPPPAKLGEFFGFLVQVPEQKVKDLKLPMKASVFSGVLTDMTKDKLMHWRDISRVEQYLIRIAYKQGFGDLLRQVGVEEPK